MRSTMAAKYILLLHVFMVVASLFTQSEAFGSGAATPQACAGAQPIHTTGGQPVQPLGSTNPYSFTVAVNEYVPGETLQVTISEASGGMVNGFFLQGRRTDTGVAVGTFMDPLPDGAQFRECTNADDSVTHTNPNGKTGLTFMWRAPAAGTGQVQFVGAVVIDHDNFYGGMMSAMLQEANPMTMEPTNSTGSAMTMEPTNSTGSAVTMEPMNTTDAAGQTTNTATQANMESTTGNAVVVSSGFGVLLLAVIASTLQFFA